MSAAPPFVTGLPIFPADPSEYLRGDGTWAVPPSGGAVNLPVFGIFVAILYNGALIYYDWNNNSNSNEEYVKVPCVAGTLKKLKIRLITKPTGTTCTCTVMVRLNGGDTALTRTMTEADSVGTVYDVNADVAVSEDDVINIKIPAPIVGDGTLGYWRMQIALFMIPS
jgi:hypothetical protein